MSKLNNFNECVEEQNKEICVRDTVETLKGREPAIVKAMRHDGKEMIEGLLVKEMLPEGRHFWTIAKIDGDKVNLTNAWGFDSGTLEFLGRDELFFERGLVDDYRYKFHSYDEAFELTENELKHKWNKYEEILKSFKMYLELFGPFFLKKIRIQTDEMCLLSVRTWGMTLQYVKEQTPNICIEAVKQNGLALQFVKEQNEEICIEAVKQNPNALQFVNQMFVKSAIETLRGREPALARAIRHSDGEYVEGLLFEKYETDERFWAIAKIDGDKVDLFNAISIELGTLEFIGSDELFFERELFNSPKYSFHSFDNSVIRTESGLKRNLKRR